MYNLELSLTDEEAVALRTLVKTLSSGKEQVMLRLKVTEAILDSVEQQASETKTAKALSATDK